jgi:hypothetical protein
MLPSENGHGWNVRPWQSGRSAGPFPLPDGGAHSPAAGRRRSRSRSSIRSTSIIDVCATCTNYPKTVRCRSSRRSMCTLYRIYRAHNDSNVRHVLPLAHGDTNPYRVLSKGTWRTLASSCVAVKTQDKQNHVCSTCDGNEDRNRLLIFAMC